MDESGLNSVRREVIDTLSGLLRSLGFEVETDIPVEGKSGLTYNFDIIGTSFCKLFEVKVGIKIRLGKTLTTEDVLNLAMTRNDTNIDKIVVVSDSPLHPSVKSLTEYYNIGVVDFDKLSSVGGSFGVTQLKVLKHFHVKPKIDMETAVKQAKCERGIFGSCKGVHKATILGYLPIYEYKVSLESPSKGDSQIEFIESDVDFESIRGSMVSVDDEGTLKLENILVNIGDLSFEVVEVARYIAEHGPLTREELSEIVSIDERKLERIILVLMDKMLIDVYGDTYAIRPLSLPGKYKSVSAKHRLENGIPTDGEILHAIVSPEKLEYLLEAFGTVHEAKLIYYPLYINVYEKKKGIYRVRLVDGNTGKRLTDFEELLEHTDDIRRIVSKIEML